MHELTPDVRTFHADLGTHLQMHVLTTDAGMSSRTRNSLADARTHPRCRNVTGRYTVGTHIRMQELTCRSRNPHADAGTSHADPGTSYTIHTATLLRYYSCLIITNLGFSNLCRHIITSLSRPEYDVYSSS
jgi:hypothetical protein